MTSENEPITAEEAYETMKATLPPIRHDAMFRLFLLKLSKRLSDGKCRIGTAEGDRAFRVQAGVVIMGLFHLLNYMGHNGRFTTEQVIGNGEE